MNYLKITLGLATLVGASAVSAQDIEPLPKPAPTEQPAPPVDPATDDAGIPVDERAHVPPPAEEGAEPLPMPDATDAAPPPDEGEDEADTPIDDTLPEPAIDPLDPAGMDEEADPEEPL